MTVSKLPPAPAEWAQRVDPTKLAPVADALERGSVPVDGRWLELGSGTGAATTVLADLVRELVALDISGEMLARAAAEPSTSRPTTLSRLFPVPGSPPRRGPAPVSGRSSPGTGEIQASSSSSDRAAV